MRVKETVGSIGRRAAILALSGITATCLVFPSLALAEISVDGQELSQGENSVGGGTATLSDSVLDMVDVVAGTVFTDEDLTINFNGDNEVDDVVSAGNASVTINANGNNEFDEVIVYENSKVTINVTGENDFDSILGFDNASIVIRGTDCQKKDTINLGEDEDDAFISTENGDLIIDHVTVNVESKYSYIGSDVGNVVIDTSKIAKEGDSEIVDIYAGGTMVITESVIEIAGDVRSYGQMTIDHSDVEATDPGSDYSPSPYRVYSHTGVELIDEENGEVKQGELEGETVWYVDTGDGRDVDLEADGEPGYYKCKGGCGEGLPATGDSGSLPITVSLLALCAMSAAVASKLTYKPRGKHAR